MLAASISAAGRMQSAAYAYVASGRATDLGARWAAFVCGGRGVSGRAAVAVSTCWAINGGRHGRKQSGEISALRECTLHESRLVPSQVSAAHCAHSGDSAHVS